MLHPRFLCSWFICMNIVLASARFLVPYRGSGNETDMNNNSPYVIKGVIECELLSFSLCVKFVLCTILKDSIYTLVAFIKQLLQYFNTFIVDIKYLLCL